MSYIRGYDPETLREQVDTRECSDRLEELGEQRSLLALLERVWLLKALDRLDESMLLSEQSVRVARMAGTRRDLLRARILHANVSQARGAYDAAIQELNTCANEAEAQGWPDIAGSAYQHAGRAHFAANDLDSAREAFTHALFLRRETGASPTQVESILLAIETVERKGAIASVAS